jgi:MFS family permease
MPSLFKRFPSVFWIVQIFELMERGAYYSMMPILAVHFIYNVGIPIWLGLILTVFMYPFQYGMPIFTSALAEKVGYRRQMIFGFMVLTVAYIFTALASNSIMAILSVMLLGFGIGTYKPLVSSTIAKATPQADRNVAYSIYYWTVNLAATLFALIWAGLLVFKVITEDMYAIVFGVSSIYFIINIIVAVFFFKEVPRSGEVKTVKDVFGNIRTAFKDGKFVVMMLLMAGFWALYSVTLAPFQTIMYGFRFLPETFPVILLGVFNPGTIILLGIPLSKFVERLESLKVLMLSVIIYIIGLIWVAFTMQNPFIAVIGIFIYSIGEFMVAPGYLAFVSKLAPKEKVSAYIGCNFLASFTGIFGGALLFGLLTNFIAVELEMPQFFFGIVITLGFLILVGFMFYYRAWGKDIIHRAALIKAAEENISIEDAREKHHEPFYLKFFDTRKSIIVPVLIIPIILIATFSIGQTTFYPPEEYGEETTTVILEEMEIISSVSGGTNEGSTDEVLFETNGTIQYVNISFSWNDEGPFRPGWTNEPDQFKIELANSTGEILEETSSSSGSLEIRYETGDEEILGGDDWSLLVTCENAGDQTPIINPLGLRERNDLGNEWDVTIRVVYLGEPES